MNMDPSGASEKQHFIVPRYYARYCTASKMQANTGIMIGQKDVYLIDVKLTV